jgi:multiple sugar transport system ATP-binding protein
VTGICLELDAVRKSYGTVETVRGVDLTVKTGEFIVIVGPSGCGKSTLLRMIAGLESITDGEVRINGKRVNEVRPKDRDIAMVFQSYALYPHMTVEENMGFALKLKKAPRAEIAEKVHAAAEILGLTPYLQRFPRELSGGQRQRVAIGRSIVRDPLIFLFDEPLSNLDAKMRVQMRVEIKTLHQRLGNTMVYVTHDQIEAMTMADRIVAMRDGHILQIGTPLEMYDEPNNIFIAQFIGSPAMNIFSGQVGGGYFTGAEGTRFVLHGRAVTASFDHVSVGVRPEYLHIAPEGSEGIAGTILLVEPTGTDTILTVETPLGRLVVLRREELSDGVELGSKRVRRIYAPGERLVLQPQQVRLFDPATGDRL